MKKTWLITALAAAMVLGAAMTSYADGWRQEDGVWVYEDSSGYLVTNEWRKGADNLWRYLDSSGAMAVNTWIDNEYYVDENGIMVTSGWKSLDANYYYDDSMDNVRWYYFQSNGKVIRDTWKKIENRWYHFDDNGAMETGWVDEDMYYCDENGAALIGWQLLYPPEGQEDDYGRSPMDDNDGRFWYYFNSSGKKYVPNNDADYGEKRIDGVYYCFNSNGAMQTGWVRINDDSSDFTSIKNYRFYGNDGKSVSGWYTAAPPEDMVGSYDDEVEWFYFAKNGEPKVGPAEGEASASDFTKINGKTYLFNDRGNPVYGLQRIHISGDEYTSYYFDEVTRTAIKGRVEVEMKDGTVEMFHFADSGRGTTGAYGGYLYYMGLLQKAEEGTKYQPITIPGYGTYVVSEAGRIAKSTSGVKNSDGTKYSTDSAGKLSKVDGEPVGSDSVWSSPTEPVWN